MTNNALHDAVLLVMPTVHFEDLGLKPYAEAWEYQTALHRALIDNKLKNRGLPPDSCAQEHRLLFVEHPPVFTLGKSGSVQNLLLTESELAARGIDYFPINRGGDITFHGPGQIVGYPILDLDCFFNDVHRYVRGIEEIMIRTLADYGLEGYRIKDYTGVWCPPRPPHEGGSPLNPNASSRPSSPPHGGGRGGFWGKQRKICAIGVHLSRWVTLHGWAFNANTPLEYFDYIVPCGIADEDKTVTSLARELGRPVDLAEVKNRLKHHFAAVFECLLI